MKGRCVICGSAGKLTEDHVPPRSVSPPTALELRRLGSTVSEKRGDSNSRGGFQAATFPSLCSCCNSERLGQLYDPVLAQFASDIRKWVSAATRLKLWIGKAITIETKPRLLARAVVGHLLAAEERRDRWAIPLEGPSVKALRNFFLDVDAPWPPGLHLYAWLYPGFAQVIVKGFCIRGIIPPYRYEPIVGDVLKFFPVAFWLTLESAGASRQNLTEIPLYANEDSEMVEISLPLRDFPGIRWPEQPGEHEIVLMNDDRTSIATPKPK